METKAYGFITGLLVLAVYFISSSIKGEEGSITPVMSALGIVIFISLSALLIFGWVFKKKNKFKKITFVLSIISLSLIGESIFVLLTFLFKAGLVLAFFNSNLDKGIWMFPLAYFILFIFNRITFKYRKIIRINAIIGTIFLFAGLFIPGRIGFILLSLTGLLFSSVLYTVFNGYIPKRFSCY
jgi:hypothetical protein